MNRLLPIAGTALLLAACGGSPQDKRPSEAAIHDAALKFARCMRDHGVDMPDPKGSGGMLTLGVDAKVPRQTMDRAQAACRHYMDAVKPPKPSAADQKRFRDAALANARCMRAHGIDFPDPTFGPDGGAQVRIGPGRGINPQSPAFKRAQQACASTMPKLGLSRAQER